MIFQPFNSGISTGGLSFQGLWNADTNTPALASGVGTDGEFYIVSVAGATTLDGISDWGIGDWAVFSTVWLKIDNSDVNGPLAAVLAVGNVSGGNDILVTAGDELSAPIGDALSISTKENLGGIAGIINILVGNTPLAGGDGADLNLQAGEGEGGGDTNIKAGTGLAEVGGTLNAEGGDAAPASGFSGGLGVLKGGAGDGPSSGGVAFVSGGASGLTGPGASATLRGADGGATSGDGGAAVVRAGDALGGGDGGADVEITAGLGDGAGDDGRINLNSITELIAHLATQEVAGAAVTTLAGEGALFASDGTGGLVNNGLYYRREADGTFVRLDVSGGGEVNTSSNSGAGDGLALPKVGVDLPFKSLTAGANITLTATATEIEVAAAGGSGLTSIDTGNTLWVDAVNGVDGTAVSGRQDLQWLTIGAALTAAVSGDIVRVRSGTYVESGLTVPSGVALIGDDFLTTIIDGSGVAGHTVTLSSGSYLQNFRIDVPTAAVFAGVTHSVGTASIYDLDLRGNGVAGLGDGVYKTGAGKIVGSNIRCDAGGLGAVCRVDSGTLALDAVHVPPSAGTISDVIHVEGTGRYQGQGLNIGASATDCIHVEGTGTVLIYSPNFANATTGLHIAADGVTVTIIGGKVDVVGASLLIDPALTGVGSILTISGTLVQPAFSFPVLAITGMELSASFHQEETATRDAEVRTLGAVFATGFPELGSGTAVGEGSPYSDGMVVLTTDATAGPGSDGGGFVDVSATAASRSGSLYTFQGLAAGNSILWCTSRVESVGVPLKTWGIELDQFTASVLGAGSFIWEIQTAVSTWVEIDVMAVSPLEQYRYANDVFLRAASEETVRLGADDSTAWVSTTISGTLGFWSRVRIAVAITTLPTFQRCRLIPSHISTNAQGQIAARGLAQWRNQLYGVGNVWGEVAGGGAADANIAVGSGGVPTGWTQKIKKGLLNGNGDAVSFQFQIPDGICTAFPLSFELVYSLVGGSPVTVAADVILSVLVLGVGGVDIADSAGGLVPVPRAATAAEAFTSKAATSLTVASDTGAVTDRPLVMSFGPYPIADYYEGDSVIIYLEMDAQGTPSQDVVLWSLLVNGVLFTTGGRL